MEVTELDLCYCQLYNVDEQKITELMFQIPKIGIFKFSGGPVGQLVDPSPPQTSCILQTGLTLNSDHKQQVSCSKVLQRHSSAPLHTNSAFDNYKCFWNCLQIRLTIRVHIIGSYYKQQTNIIGKVAALCHNITALLTPHHNVLSRFIWFQL